MVCRHFPSILGCLILLSSVTPAALAAKTRHKAPPRQDRIEVVSRLPLNGAAIAHFLVTQHYRRDYLYAEASDGNTVTLIDVSDVSRPAILADATPSLGAASVVTAAGTAALMTEVGVPRRQATDLTNIPDHELCRPGTPYSQPGVPECERHRP